MANSGLRETLGLPSVYFNLAVFEAVADIKSQWSKIKSKILKNLNRKERFTEEEKHYLRFLLKVNNCFIAVLTQTEWKIPTQIQQQWERLQAEVDTSYLHRYVCRQVRKYHVKLCTEQTMVFSLTERAYRYGNHGIFISTKEKRIRVFIPLTDQNQYQCQLSIRLFPENKKIELFVPIQVKIQKHPEYVKEIGLAMGMYTMFTTNEGHWYGEQLGEYQISYANWVREQTMRYQKNKKANQGRKKYAAKKHRFEEQLHSYINQELNRLLKEEQPAILYIVKLPKPQKRKGNKNINYSVSLWQRGYIRKRLEQKCREQSISVVEVLGKDISRECSECGVVSEKESKKKENNGMVFFCCPACGLKLEEKMNTARNILQRGIEGKVVK